MKFIPKKKKKDTNELANLHSFVICAYNSEKTLEDCVVSLLNQTLKSKIYISTSCPNDIIRNVSQKYGIELFINNKKSNHSKDFNYAYTKVNTKYVTLCHQDDVYLPEFSERVVRKMEKNKKPLIAFTNYYENRCSISSSKLVKINMLLLVKRIINFPLLLFKNNQKIRLLTLSLGNAICAPTVTYNKEEIKQPVVENNLKSNIDWISYIEFAKQKGSFIYLSKSLLVRRIHESSVTTSVINDNSKKNEDKLIFEMFWPSWLAKILLKIYSNSEKSNNI